ncbi:furin (paired basic amino acid cleaving enzyme) b [Gadus morhua]|uniref:furin (paired basic amino acid cleaving enzyme) b n=1 Tax=Gadus morhua TaxID=8049 RepID=UPI0011B5BB1D|nr:furin-like [Gadus morhua]
MGAETGLRRSWALLAFLGVAVASRWGAAAAEVYTNTWAVRVIGGAGEADRIARKHGFVNHGNVFGEYYHFRHHGVEKRSLSGHRGTHVRLQSEQQVVWAEQQVVKSRRKRDVFKDPTDPEFPKQWYLSNPTNQDLNTKEAWAKGFTGRGVVVTILDDGIEKDHPDLRRNYDPEASYDVNDGDADPQPRYTQRNENRHGTRCAGEVAAAANNGVCGVGVAYNSKIGGVRMLDGEVTDVVEAHSLSLNPQHIHVYSASWGPDDDGKSVDGPAKLAKEAFLLGITKGRGGRGSIFVWASGNGGREQDNCNCDGYTNSIYTLSISSSSQYGSVPWYSETCSSTLATTYSSGSPGEKQIVTTDLRQKCTDSHTGTSASAPLAAGIIALALEANMNLTWRDMQHLVVRTAQPGRLSAADWKANGVGRRVSHSYGYGLLDAGAMVSLAQNWTSVGLQHQCVHTMLTEPREVGVKLVFSRSVDACWGRPEVVSSLEHAQARLTLRHRQRGKLAIHLTSPLGTRSTLLSPRPNDYSPEGFEDWSFMTTHSWDEDPRGEWTLEIENVPADGGDYGVLSQFSLVLWGTGPRAVNPSSSDFPRPSNNSCKTFDAQQICIECSPGFSLFLQGCVKLCPQGFTSAAQLLNLSLETWVDLSSVQACVPCHAACLTCSGPGLSACLSCPARSHLLFTSCLRQSLVQRKSPPPPVDTAAAAAAAAAGLRGNDGAWQEVESSAGREEDAGGGDGGRGGEQPSLGRPGPGSTSTTMSTTTTTTTTATSSRLVVLSAVLGTALLVLGCLGLVLLLLQTRAAGGPNGGGLRTAEAPGGGRLGLRLGCDRKTRVCYRGIPTVWGDKDGGIAGPWEGESDGEEDHSERTAFIRTQSSV